MTEEQSFFVPHKPTELVSHFLIEHPQANWMESLGFLVDHYPQQEGEQLRWILEGSAGVYLLKPAQRPEPNDIDLVTQTEDFADQFSNSRRFDAKSVKFWCTVRGIPYTPELAEYIFSNPYETEFQKRKLLIMNPIILSASKQIPYAHRSPRSTDINDIQLLGIPTQQTQAAIQRLQGMSTK